MLFRIPTFHQLLNAGDLLAAIQGVDGPDALREVDFVGQGAGQVRQQCVKGPEPVRGDGVYYPVEVAVSVAVEANLLGPLLRGESLQGPGPVQAAVRAVRRTRHAVHPRAGPDVSLTFVALVEMLRLHRGAEAHKYGRAVWKDTGRGSGEGERERERPGSFFFFPLTNKKSQQAVAKEPKPGRRFGRPVQEPAGDRRWCAALPENNSLMTD